MSITKQLLGKVMVTNRGGYNSSTTYEILDIVSYNGSSYISKGNDNTDLPTNSNSWQLIAQKGDTYEVSETDIKNIAKQITDNANSEFNTNVNTKLKEYNDNAKNKTDAYDTNASDKLEDYNKNDTDKLSAYNSNATEKLNDYNNNVNTKLKEYNDNAENKVSEFNSTTNAQKITNLSNEFYRVKDEVLETGEASDSYIHVEDSALAEMQELEIEGVCKQEITNGKNKLTNNATSRTSNGVTFTKNSDGTVVANGTATVSSFYNIISDNEVPITTTNLILSGCPLGGTSSSYRLRATYTDGSYSEDIGSSIKLKDEKVLQIVTIVITAGTTCNNLIFKPMISSDVGGYEPYTGGQPSPSLAYPQDIKNITGKLEVTICGKNLFDKDSLVFKKNAIKDDNGNVVYSNVSMFNETYISVLPNTTYTISGQLCSGDNSSRIYFYDKEGKWISKSSMINSKILPYTFMTSSNCYYIQVQSIMAETNLDTIQIEKGSILSVYEPYVSSIVNFDISKDEFSGKLDADCRDILKVEYLEKDCKYHKILKKVLGKLILNAGTNEIWTAQLTSANGKNRFRLDISKFNMKIVSKITEIGKIISTHFLPISVEKTWFNNNGIAIDTAKYIFIYSEEISNLSLTDFKKWLSANPITIIYELESPYEIDMGPVNMPLSYNDVTNVFADSNLFPKMNVKYYRNFKTTIQNLQVNEKALKQELADINNRLSTLEIAKAIEESEAPNDDLS